jgi:hypothetical protein
VELKNGETYNGTLQSCDNYMNLNLSGVVCTSRDADKFWQIESIYIRGITIKYLCVPQETMALVKVSTLFSSLERFVLNCSRRRVPDARKVAREEGVGEGEAEAVARRRVCCALALCAGVWTYGCRFRRRRDHNREKRREARSWPGLIVCSTNSCLESRQ